MPTESFTRLCEEMVAVMNGPDTLQARVKGLEACHARAGAAFADELMLSAAALVHAGHPVPRSLTEETLGEVRRLMAEAYTAGSIPPGQAFIGMTAFAEAFTARIAEHLAAPATGGHA